MAKGQKTGGRIAGTPNRATREVKELAGSYGPAAIKRAAELAGLVKGKNPAQSESAQMVAINTILERAYGKATQHMTGEFQAAIQVVTGVPRASDR